MFCRLCWWSTALWVPLAVCAALMPMAGRRLLAAEVRTGDAIAIKAGETIADDLYVFGRHVTIDGTVEGDLVVFGESIVINGVVKGDIAAAGQSVLVQGSAEDARLAGYVIKLAQTAKLDGDLLAAGFSAETEAGSTVTGDALVAGAQALLGGQIDKDLKAGVGNLRLAGKVGGDADLEVGGDPSSDPIPPMGVQSAVPPPSVPSGLTIADTAEVTGKLNYQSPHEAKIDEGAKIGSVNHTRPAAPAGAGPAPPPPNPYVTTALTHLRHLVGVLIIGLVALVCFPRASTQWADNIRTRPGASLAGGLAGLAAFIGLLVLAVIAIVLAAVLAGLASLSDLMALVIVGGIVGYGAMIVVFWLFAAFLAEALTGLAIGRFAWQDTSLATRIVAMILGAIVVALVLSIPYAGPWIGWAVFLFGLGAFCLWLVGFNRETAVVAGAVPAVAAPVSPRVMDKKGVSV